MSNRLTTRDKAFYKGIIAALAVVAVYDAETIFREIVSTVNEEELLKVARADGAMKWCGLSRYHYGWKEKAE